MMFDVKQVAAEAQKEITEEKMKEAKRRVKEKLTLLDKAQKVVSNLERELEDLYGELGQN
jgi:ppGpp synthetase/RelA/SpoT-type nucleotidyltranferase